MHLVSQVTFVPHRSCRVDNEIQYENLICQSVISWLDADPGNSRYYEPLSDAATTGIGAHDLSLTPIDVLMWFFL
jgi:hypothetical protein